MKKFKAIKPGVYAGHLFEDNKIVSIDTNDEYYSPLVMRAILDGKIIEIKPDEIKPDEIKSDEGKIDKIKPGEGKK